MTPEEDLQDARDEYLLAYGPEDLAMSDDLDPCLTVTLKGDDDGT